MPPTGRPLPRTFFARDACAVARDLIGRRLLSAVDGQVVGGLIVEAEAYCQGPQPDLACHGARNSGRPTARTAPMFGPPGHAYVYFTYGMHWMFNIVTGAEGQASAVLIRALMPELGLPTMAARRRARPDAPTLPARDLCRGPGRLAQALGIDGRHSGLDLCLADALRSPASVPAAIRPESPAHPPAPAALLWLEPGSPASPDQLRQGPRIGLGKTPEPWLSMPWRFWRADSPFVSATRSGQPPP